MSQLAEDRIEALVDCFPGGEPGSAAGAFRSVLGSSLRGMGGHEGEPPTSIDGAVVHAIAAAKTIDADFEPDVDHSRLAEWCREADQTVATAHDPESPSDRQGGTGNPDDARIEAAGAKALRQRFL